MASLNKLMLIGNVGTDPEMRFTPNGNPVTTFRLAVSRTYKDSSDEKQTDTEWFTATCWNALAEQCNQWLTKGKRVFVEGRLKSNTWTGQDGQPRFNNEVVASRVIFLDRNTDSAEGEGEPVAVGASEDLPW